MVISASLQDEIRDIGQAFFRLFLVSTSLVLAGIVLEEVKLREKKSYVDSETGVFSPTKKPTLASLGLWLLLVGITGEGLFEMARSWMDSVLQDVSNAALLNAEAQTGNATKSAKTARAEADIAVGDVKELTKSTNELRSEIQTANKELASAERGEVVARGLLKRYIDTQLNRKTRRDVPEGVMVSILRTSTPAEAMIACEYDTTGETSQTARGILVALMTAGWKLSPYNRGGVFCVPPKGANFPPGFAPPELFPLPEMGSSEILVIAKAKSFENPPGGSPVTGLENALLTIGGGIQNVPNERVPDGMFWIVVGPKLPTPF